MCIVLPLPFSSLMFHACKWCPAIGHSALTNFISTNHAKVIGVMLKVLKKKTVPHMCETVSLSLPLCLFLTVCHSWLPSAADLQSPLYLCPLLQFNYQPALSEEPENESLIISFQGVLQHPEQLMSGSKDTMWNQTHHTNPWKSAHFLQNFVFSNTLVYDQIPSPFPSTLC